MIYTIGHKQTYLNALADNLEGALLKTGSYHQVSDIPMVIQVDMRFSQ